ncbi:hypothetical protein JKF63_01769 [Porcisia hertigi]|uniref:Uncharacterized protein n=1 Tax=Porcisia hertigi TaxID=2761500 RepID=A0A836HWT5_9TRYP|nr:hypothetical protein JKF63_01769 [Porcisia hertigi]
MLPSGVSIAGSQSSTVKGVGIHVNHSRFATPPRRQSFSFSADAEVATLTTSAFSVQEGTCTRTVGDTWLHCSATDGPLPAKPNDRITTCLSAPRRPGGTGFTASNITSGDSPCVSPRVRLSRPFSCYGSLTKPIQCSSLPSNGGPFYRAVDGAISNRSCSGLHGVSSCVSAALSEAEEDFTLTSVESVCATGAVEPLVTLRSVASTPKSTQSPISPSFAYFPSTSGGIAHETAVLTSDKANTARTTPPVCFSIASAVRDGCTTSVNTNNWNECRTFEPLRFDASSRLFSSQQQHSGPQSSHRASGFLAREAATLDFGPRSVDRKDLSRASPLPNIYPGTLTNITRQQQALHACLISIAREREVGPDSYRTGSFRSRRGGRQQCHRRRGLLSIVRSLCILLVRVLLSTTARVVTVPAAKVWQLLLYPH